MGKRFTVFSYEIDRLVHAERGKKKKKDISVLIILTKFRSNTN